MRRGHRALRHRYGHARGRESVQSAAQAVGLHVSTWSPGDGATRYRFFDRPGNTYFGPDNGIYTALGRKEAMQFIAGYTRGKR